MNMQFSRKLALVGFFGLLLAARLVAQEKSATDGKNQTKEGGTPAKEGSHGMVEFGVRQLTGDVYGRPDLQTGQCSGCGTPFQPALNTSKFNEYSDVRDGFYVPRIDLHYDNILGTNDYVSLQSQKAIYRDQSYLASFGEYGRFQLQLRY